MKSFIFAVSMLVLLIMLSHHVNAAFCCNDTVTQIKKCWGRGICCIKSQGAITPLKEAWYIGCNCSEIGGCELDLGKKCTQKYNGDVFCCPMTFHWGYRGKYLGVKGYYCNCTSPTSCFWVPFEREVNIWFSDPNPNYGETIYVYVNASYRDRDGFIPRKRCDKTTTRIKKFEIDGKDVSSEVEWDNTHKRWYFEINTTVYHSKVSVVLENEEIDGTLSGEGEFDVNFPPEISDVTHSPEPADVDSRITFEATITDPDSGDSVDAAKVCEAVTKTGITYRCDQEYCTMTKTGDNRYSCTIPLASLGTGTHQYYVWANDTSHGLANVSGPYEFTVRNITVESLLISGNTSTIVITGSGIKYDNGTLVEGSATCWINIDTANDCDVSIRGGSFSSPCIIAQPNLTYATNEFTCTVVDANNIDGERTEEKNLAASITNFELVEGSETIGTGTAIGFNATLLNSGDIDWSDNVKLVIAYTSVDNPAENLFCESIPMLDAGKSVTINCRREFFASPGKYNFIARVVYQKPGKNVTLAESSPITIRVLRIETEVKYVGLENGAVLPCTSQSICEANYSRGDALQVEVGAKFWISDMYHIQCDGSPSASEESACTAEYTILNESDDVIVPWKEPVWTAENVWKITEDTSTLRCGFYKLRVRVTHSGVTANNITKFFVSCVPRVTAVPLVARVALGTNATVVFNVTVKNPTDNAKVFDLYMEPEGLVSAWLRWIVNNKNIEDLNISNIKVNPISSASYLVNLTQAARGGVYQVKFKAVDVDENKYYERYAVVIIFAESLTEFSSIGLLLLALLSAALYFKFQKK